MNDKKVIYDILTNQNLTVEQKLKEIQNIYGNYIEQAEIKKIIFEKIEWFFHDALWTYFEVIIHQKLTEKYSLDIDFVDQSMILSRLENAKNLYKTFFSKNEYKVSFEKEVQNIVLGSQKAIEIIESYVGDKQVIHITHSKNEFAIWNSRDVFLSIEGWEDINFSLKIDKSWKVALFEGQTGDIFEKVYKRYFNLSHNRYEQILQETFGTTSEDEIRWDYYNIALLTQKIIIEQFGLKNASINNLDEAIFTNNKNIAHFIWALKYYKNGKDDSYVLKVDRKTGNVWLESVLDRIDADHISLWDFAMTKCFPRKWPHGIEPTFKFQWKAFVSFQIKHHRWKNPSNRFSDITVRLRVK